MISNWSFESDGQEFSACISEASRQIRKFQINSVYDENKYFMIISENSSSKS